MAEMSGPQEDAVLVSPVQIADLAGVGRAAVSNWRRRYPDFPQPAGGTANSPLFARADVVTWLSASNRMSSGSVAETRLRSDAAGHSLAGILEHLAGIGAVGAVDEVIAVELDELTRRRPAKEVAERLVARDGLKARGVGEFGPMPSVAHMIVGLLPRPSPDERPQIVIDPRCGLGTLLPAITNRLGVDHTYVVRDTVHDNVRVTAALLALEGCGSIDAEVGGDVFEPADPTLRGAADIVVCAVPMGRSSVEAPIPATDPRWVFGVPPQAVPELAWLQYCYWLLAPGGTCALLMLSNASTSMPGRQIRGALVRSGVLDTVVTLPSGAVPGVNRPGQIWLLRRPGTDEGPAQAVRMIDGSGMSSRQLAEASADSWRRVAQDPHLCRDVPLIDLLEGDVDLLPSRWLQPPLPDVAEPFRQARASLDTVIKALSSFLPTLVDNTDLKGGEPDALAIGALARNGAVEILPRGASTRLHDIVLNPTELGHSRIVADPEQVGETVKLPVLRCDPAQIDPYFLYGQLRTTANRRATETLGVTRDVRRARVPRLGIDEQRAYGASVKALVDFARLADKARTLSDELTALAFDGLNTGVLKPPGTSTH